MIYDIIFILGERFCDHPLCGVAILKRVLEKEGYKVGVIGIPKNSKDIRKLGEPRLFFGVSPGSVDSMVRNYTPLKKKRSEDENLNYTQEVPDRCVITYSNWIRQNFKNTPIVVGGVESSLRRFTHYDYWQNSLRKSIIFDSRADILVYGSGEKQIVEIAKRIKLKESLDRVEGTCVKSRVLPEGFIELPSHEEVVNSKERFCDLQNMLRNDQNLSQKTGNFYILQYKFPKYTPEDLDSYYEMPFNRKVNADYLKGFEFSVVTHRGCIGNCNFCSLRLLSGNKIISRSEDSILKEIKYITTLSHFKGNIDDLGGPSVNMYGMDCDKCKMDCLKCQKLDRSNARLIHLLKEISKIKGVKRSYVRSGVRYDLASDEYLKELKNHISGNLKIAPEHVNEKVLEMMNKKMGNLDEFIKRFKKICNEELSFYFMVDHPGCGMKEAKELADGIRGKKISSVQIFTPTPMTVSTCMYYTGLNPKTKKPIYVPRTYKEKKMQKKVLGKFYYLD